MGHRFWRTPMIPAERESLVRDMFSDPDGRQVPSTREADVMTATGERLRIIWNNNLVRDPEGRVVNVVCTGTDVTSARDTTAVLRHLLEAPVATALVGLDERGRISVFNQGAQQLLRRTTQDVLGRHVSEIVVSPQPERYLADAAAQPVVTETSAAREPRLRPQTSDWTWRADNGRELTVSTTISVVENDVGATLGYLCVGRDVTEQRRTQEMLVEALERERHGMDRLRRLDTAKNDFVSTVSHELRTPTTSIVGYTEMLRDGAAGEPTPEQIVMLDAIARNGKRLIAVASDLLTLSELESDDSSQWEREPVDLAAIVGQGEEAIRPMLASRDLSVVFEVPERRRDRHRRRGAPGPGADEPALQRGEVHAQRRSDHLSAGGDGVVGAAWRSATPGSASPRRSSPSCSPSSSGPRPRRSGPSRAPAWACRSSTPSWPRTAATSTYAPRTCRAPRSR